MKLLHSDLFWFVLGTVLWLSFVMFMGKIAAKATPRQKAKVLPWRS